MESQSTCPVCNKKVSPHMYKIKCSLCSNFVHRNCTSFSKDELNNLVLSKYAHWSCRLCKEAHFAFNHFDDEDTFRRCVLELSLDNTNSSLIFSPSMLYNPFDLNDEEDYIPCADIDPDTEFYKSATYPMRSNSNYYNENSFNKSINKLFNNKRTFSLLHLNIRSIPANLSSFLHYHSNLNFDFDIIGITESWLTVNNNGVYSIDGYNHVSLVRTDRHGGGVSLFILSNINFK